MNWRDIVKNTANDSASAFGVNTGQWMERLNIPAGTETRKYWEKQMTPEGRAATMRPPINSQDGVNLAGIAMNYLIDPVNVLAQPIRYLRPVAAASGYIKAAPAVTATTNLTKVPGAVADVLEVGYDQFKR